MELIKNAYMTEPTWRCDFTDKCVSIGRSYRRGTKILLIGNLLIFRILDYLNFCCFLLHFWNLAPSAKAKVSAFTEWRCLYIVLDPCTRTFFITTIVCISTWTYFTTNLLLLNIVPFFSWSQSYLKNNLTVVHLLITICRLQQVDEYVIFVSIDQKTKLHRNQLCSSHRKCKKTEISQFEIKHKHQKFKTTFWILDAESKNKPTLLFPFIILCNTLTKVYMNSTIVN